MSVVCYLRYSRRYVAFKPVLARASCVFDIADFGEIGESNLARTVSSSSQAMYRLRLRYISRQLPRTMPGKDLEVGTQGQGQGLKWSRGLDL